VPFRSFASCFCQSAKFAMMQGFSRACARKAENSTCDESHHRDLTGVKDLEAQM